MGAVEAETEVLLPFSHRHDGSVTIRVPPVATPSPNIGFPRKDSKPSGTPGTDLRRRSLTSTVVLGSPATASLQPDSGGRPSTFTTSPMGSLAIYFGISLILSIYNKFILQGFPFPWVLSSIHMLFGLIGSAILQRSTYSATTDGSNLTVKENLVLLAFSFLYTVNIGISSLSLQLVSITFHQVVRSMTPVFTVVLSFILFRQRYSWAAYASLVPVTLGVSFAVVGEYDYTREGFVLTLIGAWLASLKGLITQRLLVGRLKLRPMELVAKMSPLAFVQCLAIAWYSGELSRLQAYAATELDYARAAKLAVNGALAFALNVANFNATGASSAVMMSVAANVKQVLTIVLAVVAFHLRLGPMNLLGIAMTLGGGALYSRVELRSKQQG